PAPRRSLHRWNTNCGRLVSRKQSCLISLSHIIKPIPIRKERLMVKEQAGGDRRAFLKGAALAGTVALAAGSVQEALAQAAPDWKDQIGLELYTVRDVMQKDYEGVLAKIASFGYKEVEPANGYNNMSPKDWRAMLDRYGLSAPSTHSGLPPGDTVEARLEGGQVMGFKYIENLGGGGPPGGGPGASGRGPGRGPATPAGQGRTTETVKR